MADPDDYRQYRKLAEALRQMGHFFSRELPAATASLHLHSRTGTATLDVYDRRGMIISRLPNLTTSQSFKDAIERLGKEHCPDPSGVVCPLVIK